LFRVATLLTWLGAFALVSVALAEPKVDRLVDPLPPGAVARLGTARLVHGDSITIAPDRLRVVRAVEALEAINSPEARQVLADLAKGPAVSRLVREAKASLERMGKVP
jgi:hypothetical protein